MDVMHGLTGGKRVAIVHDIAQPHLEGIEAHRGGDLVHLSLVGPADLGHAISTKTTGRRGVGVDSV
jgi:hypothetical protein